MSIYDRDYMRDSSATLRSPSPVSTIVRVAIVLFSLYLLFFALRMGMPLYVKFPLLIGIGLAVRWFFSFPRRMDGEFYLQQGAISERRNAYGDAARYYELAAERLPDMPQLALRLLAAYDATQRGQKAMNLIPKLNGMVFGERDIEELEFLVTKHREVSFEKAGEKYKVRLGAVREP